VDGVSTNYLVDTNRSLAQVAAEYDSSGVKASYTYAGGVISQSSNNVRTFYVNDGHSGVRLITNNTGVVTDAYNYDGYGNLLQSVGNANNERYRGEASDAATGLQYLRARYYDPSTGRFLSTDAFEGVLESPVSRHRYLYGNNNPITYSDPSGNSSTTMGDATQTLAIIAILTGLGGIIYNSSTLTRARNNSPIKWDGIFSNTFSIDSKTLSDSGFNVPWGLGLGTYFLTAETEPIDFGTSISQYKNTWFIITGVADFGPPDEAPPVEFDPTETEVKLRSPSIFGANMWTFFGEFLGGEVEVPGAFEGAGFIIGVGKGWYADESNTSFYELNLNAGLSFPTGIGKRY
jgi:RHS repeat-associated protein